MQATPDRLRALLWDLADDDRILLECRIVDAWGYADTSAHLGVPRDVLADRVHRLRTDLRRAAKALKSLSAPETNRQGRSGCSPSAAELGGKAAGGGGGGGGGGR